MRQSLNYQFKQCKGKKGATIISEFRLGKEIRIRLATPFVIPMYSIKYWAANYVVTQTFPMVTGSEMNNNSFWNGSLPYFIFIGFILVIIVFTYKFLPETKGKTLEEIEGLWEK